MQTIYESTGVAPGLKRRETLIAQMASLEEKAIHCFNCPGTCCTSMANSMQITPLEALEILAGLKVEHFLPKDREALKARLQETVKNNRLDVEIYTAKKGVQVMRRSYTCPFFNQGTPGCSLSRSFKPYGCLGFNPQSANDNGQTCASQTDLLEEREDTHQAFEKKANLYIQEAMGLEWTKLSIPQALLSMLKHSN